MRKITVTIMILLLGFGSALFAEQQPVNQNTNDQVTDTTPQKETTINAKLQHQILLQQLQELAELKITQKLSKEELMQQLLQENNYDPSLLENKLFMAQINMIMAKSEIESKREEISRELLDRSEMTVSSGMEDIGSTLMAMQQLGLSNEEKKNQLENDIQELYLLDGHDSRIQNLLFASSAAPIEEMKHSILDARKQELRMREMLSMVGQKLEREIRPNPTVDNPKPEDTPRPDSETPNPTYRWFRFK